MMMSPASSTSATWSTTVPVSPAGIVATMRSQARRSSGVSIFRVFKVRKNPTTIRRQVSREVASGTEELRVAAATPKPSICCT